MAEIDWKRREFIRTLIAGLTAGALDWSSLPTAEARSARSKGFDAVIIGSGLGGLSCAAAFARQGFKPLVLEHHDKAGGYATAFKRPGGFYFDVSLHSTTVAERNGAYNLIPGVPEITSVDFVPLPTLYRAIFPDHDIRVPNRNLPEYLKNLAKDFPDEKEGITSLFNEMKELSQELGQITRNPGAVDMSEFPVKYPEVVHFAGSTWGNIVDEKIRNPKLKGIISALWGYYGLPPSRLASIYYAYPTYSYLTAGGFYPRGRSQTISNALVSFIEGRGGKVLLETMVEKIVVKDGTAVGVRTTDGKEYAGKVVVSNANACDTFHKLVGHDDHLKDYLARIDGFSVSLSTLIIFLGLKRDLVHELKLTDTELFYTPTYDMEAAYQGALNADTSNPGFGLMLYDNLFPGYSPKGKNTLTLMTLQGYDHWKPYAAGYWSGNKRAYDAEKERIANVLIRKAEEIVLPGLSKAIEVKEIGTPLTNIRYTRNYRGAIYGWDQTLDNSNPRRLPHATPVKNLYLAGAWTSPGGGYGGVIGSGLECFGEIMKHWT